MKFGLALIIAAIVLFIIAAVYVFVDKESVVPLGLIAVGLACSTGAKVT